MERKTDTVWKHPRMLLAAIIAVAVVIVAALIMRCTATSSIGVVTSDKIDNTPQTVESLRSVGEWEFLSVADEEVVDTTSSSLLGDSHLVRIYYGTLRLGIDMSRADESWINVSGDTARVALPEIALLDDNFIDETRTKAFFESGTWTDADRKALYEKAHRQMIARCMTPSNMRSARENALRQVHSMMESMGFKTVEVRFRTK